MSETFPPTAAPSAAPAGRRVALGVLASVALVAAGVAGAVVLPSAGPPHPDRWDPRLVDLVEFVESERGLAFEHPIYVDFLTAEEYTARTTIDEGDLTAEDRRSIDDLVAELRALGLASGDVDVFESVNELSDTGTLAFYEPGLESAAVRGTELDVATRVSVVHELTHALQDQHFDLDEMQERAGDSEESSGEAVTALIEGDAVRIEEAYVSSLPPDESDEYFQDHGDMVAGAEDELGDVPAVLQAFQVTPYALGPALVDMLVADGGNRAVDEAFEDPPTTGEHLLEPLSFLDRDPAADVEAPPLPDEVDQPIDEDHMSAVDLYLILGTRIDAGDALTAADGWGGSPFVAYEDGGRTCVRIRAEGDTGGDSAELYDAFERWVAAAPPEAGASLSGDRGGPAVLESCDPGAAADAVGADRALDLLVLPAVRSILAAEHVRAGGEPADGWAAADCVVRRFTLDDLVAADNFEAPPGFDEAFANAMTTCAVPVG